jgi:hypothetical protein
MENFDDRPVLRAHWSRITRRAGQRSYHFLQSKRERFLLLATMAVFLASLTFRSIDDAICSHVAIGTHFLWHILNGVVLYLSMRALILNRSNGPA